MFVYLSFRVLIDRLTRVAASRSGGRLRCVRQRAKLMGVRKMKEHAMLSMYLHNPSARYAQWLLLPSWSQSLWSSRSLDRRRESLEEVYDTAPLLFSGGAAA